MSYISGQSGRVERMHAQNKKSILVQLCSFLWVSYENRVRYGTDSHKRLIDTISIIDTSKLSFSTRIKNTGMPGDGGQNIFDI